MRCNTWFSIDTSARRAAQSARTALFTFCCATVGLAQGYEHVTEPHSFQPQSGSAIDAELGTFRVPENRTRGEGGRRIQLRYVRFPATTDSPGPPIVYVAGGPGGSGTAAARGPRLAMFQALRQLGDVIAIDQRGTGMSDGLPAGRTWSVPADKPATRESISEAVATAIEGSLSDWQAADVDLDAYNTRESAHDLEALRIVLDAEKLRLVGISYGTHLSLATMRYFPGSVQSAVLAGVEGPDHTVKMPIDQQRLLEQIDRWIKDQPKAREAFPDFLGSVERVLKRLEDEPFVVENGDTVTLVVTHFDVQRLTAGFLRGPETIRMLPHLFKQMDEGNFSRLPLLLYMTGIRRGQVRAMNNAMDAASGRTEARAELIRKQADETLLGDAINFPYELSRRLLGVRDLGDEFRAPLTSEIPVLAISGTADGRTPASNAEEVLAGLINGSHLVVDGAGHGDQLFLSSPEIVESMLRFFAGEDVGNARIELPPIEFELPQ